MVAEHDGALLGFYRLAGHAPVEELGDLFLDPVAIGSLAGRELPRFELVVPPVSR